MVYIGYNGYNGYNGFILVILVIMVYIGYNEAMSVIGGTFLIITLSRVPKVVLVYKSNYEMWTPL